MSFSIFINFDGDCMEALKFYSKVFRSETEDLMLYKDMPTDPGQKVAKEDLEKVAYSAITMFGCRVMFCDVPSEMELIRGNNISPTLSTDDKEEIRRIFTELGKGGTVMMELQKTFWSELYGMVQDRYGIVWQLSHYLN